MRYYQFRRGWAHILNLITGFKLKFIKEKTIRIMNVLTSLKLIAALVAGCLITYSCGKDKEKPEVTLKQYQVPVLKIQAE